MLCIAHKCSGRSLMILVAPVRYSQMVCVNSSTGTQTAAVRNRFVLRGYVLKRQCRAAQRIEQPRLPPIAKCAPIQTGKMFPALQFCLRQKKTHRQFSFLREYQSTIEIEAILAHRFPHFNRGFTQAKARRLGIKSGPAGISCLWQTRFLCQNIHFLAEKLFFHRLRRFQDRSFLRLAFHIYPPDLCFSDRGSSSLLRQYTRLHKPFLR